MKYNITRNGELVKSFIEIDDETFNDLGLEEDSEYDYTVEIAGQPESKASVSTKTLDSRPQTTIFVSNKVLVWDNLPAYNQPNNGSLTLVSDNEDGTYTYEVDFEWNNRSGRSLDWLVDVLQFKYNKLENGSQAFRSIPAEQLTALPDLDTSNVTDMYGMFFKASVFNQPLDHFETSNVEDMSLMFKEASAFNQTLDNFDTSNVTNMYSMFYKAQAFDQSLDHFKTSKVENMGWMFRNATVFNHPVPFDTSSVTTMQGTFYDAVEFNQSLETWDTSLVETMAKMFQNANSFDHPVDFNTSKVTSMNAMFQDAKIFNQPVPFNTSNVTDMSNMFYKAEAFDQPVEFDTSKVTNMNSMFDGAKVFNHPVEFDTSNVTNGLSSMFKIAEKFNQPVNFDTSNVTNMDYVFDRAYEFNQSLETWDTSKVTRMKYMFGNATIFNQPLDHFNTSEVKDMWSMFADAQAFDQDISNWCVSKVEGFEGPGTKPYRFDYHAGFRSKPDKQPKWGTPCTTIIVSNKELTWDDLPANEQEDNGSLTLVSDNGDGTYTYEADFEWDNNGKKDLDWLVDVLQFKDNQLKAGSYAFQSMPAEQLTALPKLDTSNLTDMTGMFCKTQFNQSLDHFDTSNVTNMHRMFANAYAFNQPLDNFDTSNVTDMGGMFRYATAFNQPLDFDTSNATDMDTMFNWATSFNQDISNWCVEGIDSKPGDFDTNSGFEGQDDKQPCWGYCGCDEVPPEITSVTNTFVSNKELTWADLPANGQSDDGSLTLVSDNGDGTYTYEADFDWDNSGKLELTWLVDVLQFKNNQLKSGEFAFYVMPAAQLTALPKLDTSNLTNMIYMFAVARNFNQPLDNFDTSNVTDMGQMFGSADSFNQPLDWDTSNVTHMEFMFTAALVFDQPLNWDTSNVTNMRLMFSTAERFNQPLNFDTSNVTDMNGMFSSAYRFNQDISNWCVSQIDSEPFGFDYQSGFENQTARQPKWGKACSNVAEAQVVEEPKPKPAPQPARRSRRGRRGRRR